MNKRLKWGLTAVVLAGAAALGAYSMLPQENEELAAAGVSPDLIRLSCGIEGAEDLIADIENALKSI